MTELEKAKAFNQSIKDALLTVYNALNKGQKSKLLKDEAVKELFDRYHVIPDEITEEQNG